MQRRRSARRTLILSPLVLLAFSIFLSSVVSVRCEIYIGKDSEHFAAVYPLLWSKSEAILSATRVQAVLDDLEDARLVFKRDLNLKFKVRKLFGGRMDVKFRKMGDAKTDMFAEWNYSLLLPNYIAVNSDLLANKDADLKLLRATVGHELFHEVQYQYHGGCKSDHPVAWLDEALSTWFEMDFVDRFVQGDSIYGIAGHLLRDKGLLHRNLIADDGYGGGAIINYVVNRLSAGGRPGRNVIRNILEESKGKPKGVVAIKKGIYKWQADNNQPTVDFDNVWLDFARELTKDKTALIDRRYARRKYLPTVSARLVGTVGNTRIEQRWKTQVNPLSIQAYRWRLMPKSRRSNGTATIRMRLRCEAQGGKGFPVVTLICFGDAQPTDRLFPAPLGKGSRIISEVTSRSFTRDINVTVPADMKCAAVLVVTVGLEGRSLPRKFKRASLSYHLTALGADTANLTVGLRQAVAGKKTDIALKGGVVELKDAQGNPCRGKKTGIGTYKFEFLPAGRYEYRATAQNFTDMKGNDELVGSYDLKIPSNGAPPYNCSETLYMQKKRVPAKVKVCDVKGRPIPTAMVKAVSESHPAATKAAIGVDSDGECGFSDLEPGIYRFRVNAPGYDGPESSDSIVLDPAKRPPGMVKVKLQPFLSTVVVTVQDVNGQMIHKARVSLAGDTEKTDRQGKAEFKKMWPSGHEPYVIKGERDGYAPAQAKLAVQPKDKESIFGKTLILAQGKLRVRVTDEATGRPVRGASVMAQYMTYSPTKASDADGMASFAPLPLGGVLVSAAADGYLDSDRKEIVIGPGLDDLEKSANITLKQGVEFDVFVYDKKTKELIPGSFLSIDDGRDMLLGTGRATLAAKIGAHTCKAKARGYSEQSSKVNVVAGDKRPSVTFYLERGVTVSVEVRKGKTELLRGAASRIFLYIDGRDRPIAVGDGPAHTFSGLVAGKYYAKAEAEGYKPGRSSMVNAGTDIDSSSVTADVLLEPEANMAVLRVMITAKTGKLPVAVNVSLKGEGVAKSDDGPAAVFRDLPAGTYTVSASANGFEPQAQVITLAQEKPGHAFDMTLSLAEESPEEDVPKDVTTDETGDKAGAVDQQDDKAGENEPEKEPVLEVSDKSSLKSKDGKPVSLTHAFVFSDAFVSNPKHRCWQEWVVSIPGPGRIEAEGLDSYRTEKGKKLDPSVYFWRNGGGVRFYAYDGPKQLSGGPNGNDWAMKIDVSGPCKVYVHADCSRSGAGDCYPSKKVARVTFIPAAGGKKENGADN